MGASGSKKNPPKRAAETASFGTKTAALPVETGGRANARGAENAHVEHGGCSISTGRDHVVGEEASRNNSSAHEIEQHQNPPAENIYEHNQGRNKGRGTPNVDDGISFM